MTYLKKPKYNIGQNIQDKTRNFTIIDYYISERFSKGNKIREYTYKCKCNNCNYIFIKRESDIVRGRQCACCNNKIVIKGINDISTTASWMIPYFPGGINEAQKYTKSSNKKITFKCPNCGKLKDKKIAINNLYYKKSIGCVCNYNGVSYPERFMNAILEQLNYEYIYQYCPKWANGRRYDFYIPSLKIIIEMDGRLGHGFSRFGKSNGEFDENSKQVDILKDKMAKDCGIEVIRIDCKESDFSYIKDSIINSKLNQYFTFSEIDFVKCEKQSMTNLIKEICLFYETHKDYSCAEIAKIFNIGTYTVTRYLKKGNTIGWCSYSIEQANKKRIEKQKEYYKNNPKKSIYEISPIPVIGIKNDSILYFNSIKEAADFVNTRCGRIKDVCDGKPHCKTTKGYIWKYANKNAI